MPDAPDPQPITFNGRPLRFRGHSNIDAAAEASGTALDSLAAVYGVERQSRMLPYTFENGGRVEYEEESDEELRYRLLGFRDLLSADARFRVSLAARFPEPQQAQDDLERCLKKLDDLKIVTPPSGPSRWALVDEEGLA